MSTALLIMMAIFLNPVTVCHRAEFFYVLSDLCNFTDYKRIATLG